VQRSVLASPSKHSPVTIINKTTSTFHFHIFIFSHFPLYSNSRSYQKELLDRDDIPFEDIRQNMYELDVINRKLGGHAITVAGLKKTTEQIDVYPDVLRIVEIGCGGGDNLRVIKEWAKAHDIKVQLTGVDINPECVRYAQSVSENKGMHFICSDYRDASFEQNPDVIFSSLFCHHFNEKDLVFMMKWMRDNCRIGFFINDLHRHPLAYYSIKLLTKAFSKSYLVKNDAPLSVQRGFTRKEWESIFKSAGINNYTIEWRWAFRWLVTYRSNAT
jgi:SAM-dependent methyltransferase